jgi:hypothetical protein
VGDSRFPIYATGRGRATRKMAAFVALFVSGLSANAQGYQSSSENGTGADPTASAANPPPSSTIGASDEPRGRIELKRDGTSRGTPEETSKTTLRIEGYPDGLVSLLRLDVPFPDGGQGGLLSSPFSPEIGDLKIRTGFRPFHVIDLPISFFSDVTFPTATSASVGDGKYQLGPGFQTTLPISMFGILPSTHRLSFAPLAQQVVSVAGDAGRKNINYTKLELALKDVWREEYWLKLTLKPVMDWQQGGRTGSVVELEGGVRFSPSWEGWLMVGHRLWGGVVPTTYDTRLQIGIARLF